MKELPPVARVYWAIVVMAGIGAIAGSAVVLAVSAPQLKIQLAISMVALAVLAVIFERMVIELVTFDEAAAQSIGSVAFIAAVVVLPWYAAILVASLGVATAQLKRPPIKSLFNICKTALAVGAGALVFQWLGGNSTLETSSGPTIAHALLSMAALSFAYYAASILLLTTMIALLSGQKIWQIYHANHLTTTLQEATAIGLGLMLGGFWLFSPAFAPLVALPVVMAYFSIQTSVRIQQETRQSVLALSESIDHRDPLTYDHSKRVAVLSVALARELDLSHEQVATIELSALVHDIGKIGIPSEILMKPGKLTPEERAQMEMHPVIGYDMLRHYKQFRKGLGIVRWHHEAWDGTGYPDRIPSREVPIEARVVCIADAFEAMTADRPYRKAMSSAVAFERLEEAAGTQFDPNLVPVFRTACERIGEVPISHPKDDQDQEHLPLPQPELDPQVIRALRGRKIRRLPASSARCGHTPSSIRAQSDA